MPLSLPSPRSLSAFLVALTLAGAMPLAAQQTTTSAPETTQAASGLPEGAQREPDGTIVLRSGRRIPPPLYQDDTPEKRMERFNIKEDPGLDPDPEKIWSRYGKTFKIQKFDRMNAAYDGELPPGWVRPMWAVNIPKEIYREDEKNLWVWMEIYEVLTPEEIGAVKVDADQSMKYTTYTDEQLGFIRQLQGEMKVIEPKTSSKVIRFREASEGLPTSGSWRNALAVADMNEDGFMDLVIPPLRGGASILPVIYLGDGAGTWKAWETAKWPMGINYGSVEAGDLNGDGHVDLVFGVHLYGVVAFLGDGNGTFTAANEGLPSSFPTRRAIIRDVNGDGKPDIIAISEGPTLSRQEMVGSPLRAFLNDGTGTKWTEVAIAEPERDVAGDWVTTADLNGDKWPDLVGASVIFHGTDIIHLSKGKNEWESFGRGWLPFYSYYGALTAGKFSSKKRDDIILSFARAWPQAVDPKLGLVPEEERIVGLERVWFEGKTAKRVPIVQWASNGPVWGLADGDFDGDGRLDVIYWRPRPHEFVMLLGDGKGGFTRATLEGIASKDLTLYDIKVADVNADRRPDVIVMYEAQSGKQGSVHVFLNEGGASR